MKTKKLNLLSNDNHSFKKFINNDKQIQPIQFQNSSMKENKSRLNSILTSQGDTSLAYSFKPKELGQYLHQIQVSIAEKIKRFQTKKNGSYREFRKIKFNKVVYELNDTVLVKNLDDNHNDFIGKINKIILLDYQQKLEPALYLQWYFKKQDLPPQFDCYRDCISDNEVFLTEEGDYTCVDCLNGKCTILTYDEYDSQPTIKQNLVFYSRASYDAKKETIINPPIDKWEKHCICQKPFNPDLPYICCDKCERWFHIECLHISLEKAQDIDFVCDKCKGMQQNEPQY